jgi:hypothetical protein
MVYLVHTIKKVKVGQIFKQIKNSLLSMFFFKEVKIVWYIISILIILLLSSLLLFNSSTLLYLSPKCTSILLYKKPCFLCGTTRAFVEIKNLNFNKAYFYNAFSIPLFSLFIINSLFYILSFKKNSL